MRINGGKTRRDKRLSLNTIVIVFIYEQSKHTMVNVPHARTCIITQL